MRKISVIFGTRPEAIKLAPVINALKRQEGVTCHVCVTAQHRHLLDQVLDTFDIVPDVDLDLMQSNQTLSTLTARAIIAVDQYLAEYKPDVVLVQGDTTTSFCGALAAFYHQIPIGHIEAGLRTGNIASPWPEEANRLMTTRLAHWHFAPTETNRSNLLKEGITDNTIFVTGNTVIDALLVTVQKMRDCPPEIPGLPGNDLTCFGDRRMVLITGHRRENFGSSFRNICLAVADLTSLFPDVHFVYPVHPNPNVLDPVRRILRDSLIPNMHLIEPLSYYPFIALMDRAHLVLTDSGGVQEEAPSLGKPVLVMRDKTERTEALITGTVKLVGTNREKIVREVSLLLSNDKVYQTRSKIINPYGDGHATERILRALNV